MFWLPVTLYILVRKLWLVWQEAHLFGRKDICLALRISVWYQFVSIDASILMFIDLFSFFLPGTVYMWYLLALKCPFLSRLTSVVFHCIQEERCFEFLEHVSKQQWRKKKKKKEKVPFYICCLFCIVYLFIWISRRDGSIEGSCFN